MWTSEQQIKRLLRPGSTYFNLNPYEVSVCVSPLASYDGVFSVFGVFSDSSAMILGLVYVYRGESKCWSFKSE